MSVLFSVQPGYAVAVKSGVLAPLRIGIQNWGNISSGDGFLQRKAIITGISFGEEDNYQVMQTLRDFLYFHVFGRKAVPLMVSGLAFAGSCDLFSQGGLDQVRGYFAANRVSIRDQPLAVAIGSIGFQTFLVKSNYGIQNPEAGISQFGLMFQCEAGR